MTQKTDNQETDNRKIHRKKGIFRKAAAVLLALLLSLSPVGSRLSGSFVQAAEFKIEMLQKGSMLADYNFYFFNVRVGTGIFYWVKSDGSPLFCVQKDKSLLGGLNGSETTEEFGSRRYFSDQQYELVSLVLQSCGLRRGETQSLTPGEYLAGQAAVWGILTGNWESTDQLKEEMEVLHEHVGDWNEWTSGELIADSRKMTDAICQAIDDYYSDSSPYVPSFASKYPDKAPLWQAQWQDNVCEITFALDGRAEAIKDFTYELPQGWTCRWEEDRITFKSEDADPGTYTITGYAPEETGLGEAMPIGLIYIVAPSNYPTFQHLASGVEVTVPWSCYFRIYVPEKPDDTGSWSLEETQYYRHQEEFEAVYGAAIEKRDGETGDFLAGAVFQPLEYFDSGQLEDTVLDKTQFTVWDGWQARCPEEITGEDGRIIHTDRKTYHYEKTYCGGHPDPKIYYEGNSESRREEIEAEAWAAWEAEAEACARRCDFHQVDGSAVRELEADRDLAYAQFISLVYGYTFREVQASDGYRLPENGGNLKKVFCTSLQAGGEAREEENELELSARSTPITRASAGGQAGSPAKEASSSNAVSSVASPSDAVPGDAAPTGESLQGESPRNGENGRKASQSQALRTAAGKNRSIVWLTSQLPPLDAETADYSALYTYIVDNFRDTPEETPPEETTPEETPPEETSPEETPPEEATPEEITPEETKPEETTPEETTPEETTPEETLPEATLPVREPHGGGGRDRERTETSVIPDAEVPEGAVRQGWIEAFYEAGPASGSEAGKRDDEPEKGERTFPKTGDRDETERILLTVILAETGFLGIFLWLKLRKREHTQKSGKKGRFHWMIWAVFLLSGLMCQRQETYAASQPDEEGVLIRCFDSKDTDSGADVFIPEEWYADEDGETYRLDFYRKIESEIPGTQEQETRTMMFYGIENPGQIPDRIPAVVQDEENQRQGSGMLEQAAVKEISSSWSEDFQVLLTFYDYGAESYRFGDFFVPGEDALGFLAREQEAFLETIGCSPLRYQIREFVWEGESYQKDGILCRNASARGRRLLSDYQAEFSGVIYYPPVTRSQWQAVYRILRETLPETEEETRETAELQESAAPVPETEVRTEEENQPSSGWKITRLLLAYTISLAVLVPFLLFLIFYAGKRRNRFSRK